MTAPRTASTIGRSNRRRGHDMERAVAGLFDHARKRRVRHGGTDLVPLDPDVCPTCGASPHTDEQIEPALVRHGGHGAARRTLRLWCPCGWSITREVAEVHPDTDVTR